MLNHFILIKRGEFLVKSQKPKMKKLGDSSTIGEESTLALALVIPGLPSCYVTSLRIKKARLTFLVPMGKNAVGLVGLGSLVAIGFKPLKIGLCIKKTG